MAYQPKSYRKFLAGSVSAALVATAIGPVAASAANDFSDVSSSYWAHDEISALANEGIINGFPNGTFGPDLTLTRGQAAKLFQRALGLEVPADLNSFSDLEGHSDQELLAAAAAVKAAGIFKGSNGEFGAEDVLTRAQMASVIVRAFGLEANDVDVTLTDLDTIDVSHRDNVSVLFQNGITTGRDNGTIFDGADSVTRAQFATFLYRALGYDVDLSASVKAINTTTVEVMFEDAIEDVDALNFAIEGLEVENAAVKQTNSKVAVLTTSPQEGGEVYTVTVDGEEVGSFEGVSAVVPTDIEVVSHSLQGIVGKEVTVQAEVTVADGESKAGIPVTFNIAANADFNNAQVVEVFTNEDGIAEYSYTQYAGGEDYVTAYATGNADLRSTSGMVYWGVTDRLTITEVDEEEGNTIDNGESKVYKVKATTPKGGAESGYVNVTFAENVNVDPDQSIRSVVVTDVVEGEGEYPYQYTNGRANQILVKLDKDGEATFTVTGEDASVTPVVFFNGEFDEDEKHDWDGVSHLSATDLQAQAETVTFEDVEYIDLEVESVGTKYAAAITNYGLGGREYKVTVTDEDGELAPKGTKVYVTLEGGDFDGDVYFEDESNQFTGDLDEGFYAKTDADGVATFRIIGEFDDDDEAYATPTFFLNNGSDDDELDSKDTSAKGEIVYFGDAEIEGAGLTVLDEDGNPGIEETTVGEAITFVYSSVDQNGFAYYDKDEDFDATFTVDAKIADVDVYYGDKVVGSPDETVRAGHDESFKLEAHEGQAAITIVTEDATKVVVDAHASGDSLPKDSATVEFNKYSTSEVYGFLGAYDTSEDELTIIDRNGEAHNYSYAGEEYEEKGYGIEKSEFERLLDDEPEISVTSDDEGNLTFNIVDLDVTPIALPDADDVVDDFVDADADAGELQGDITFTTLDGVAYDVTVGTFNTNFTGNGNERTVAVPADTVADSVEITVSNGEGYEFTASYDLSEKDNDDNVAADELVRLALEAINEAAYEGKWDGVDFNTFGTAEITDVTAANEGDVKEALEPIRQRGGELTAAEIQDVVDGIVAQPVIDAIAALDNTSDQATVDAVRADYNLLSSAQQALVDDTELVAQENRLAADATAVSDDALALTAPAFNVGADQQAPSFTLVAAGANGTTITWSAGGSAFLTDAGVVTRDTAGNGDQTVTLTATITRGLSTEDVTFEVVIPDLTDIDLATGGDQYALVTVTKN
ncbi:S-layer homology domain-containing protein [Cytobacillus sp. IB215665]|uniref:S-layer homology domain-containing protein n=1 Tax=Cytobacillus sp. IB215665 TaxID=3097357 RepID=UPI002A0AD485|nr:S-layer homology domain-containing protein [Cytobacillus sp. IB215665]MDX8363771.1 S-layer homology domain-containing protein [Cytobacillus sp. IB215665]